MNLAQARAIAAAVDRERTAIENRAVARANFIARLAAASAAQAFRRGDDPRIAFRSFIRSKNDGEFVSLIADAMTVSTLTGWQRAATNAVTAVNPGRVKKLGVFEDVMGFLERDATLFQPDIGLVRTGYGKAAQSVLDQIERTTYDRLTSRLDEIRQANIPTARAVAAVSKAFADAGVSGPNPYAIETAIRTQAQIAWSAGSERFDKQQHIQEILWGYVYLTVGDNRVRDSHRVMDGMRAPKDDPIWNTWTPPCGWNCRCNKVGIFKGQRLAVPTSIPDAQPDKGFAFNPGDLPLSSLAA